PTRLEAEQQQASRHQGAEQYDLANLHLPTPREAARNLLCGDRDLFQEIELVEHSSGPERDARQRLVAWRHREVGLLAQEMIQTPEQRAARRRPSGRRTRA